MGYSDVNEETDYVKIHLLKKVAIISTMITLTLVQIFITS